MKPPSDLSAAGKRLWRQVESSLPDKWELDERDGAVLTLAARQADTVASLERAIKQDGVTVAGSNGQPCLNAAVVELRQGRLAVARLIGQLALPNSEGDARTEAGRRAQHAAKARWDRKRRQHGAA